MTMLFFFKKQPIKLGLALGGGATRGFAHVGAIKAFEEHNVKFDYVAGTSAGSIVGALYCAGATSQDLINISHELNPREIKSALALPPIDTVRLENILKRYLGDITFKDLKIPFIAVAVDLKTGGQAFLQHGSIAKAVSASCAIPFFFKPVIIDNMHLVDGGLLNSVPSDVPKIMGADRVVAIDVNSQRGYGTDSLKVLDIIGATIRIMSSVNAMIGRRHADVLIEPDVSRFNAASKAGYMEMIDIGYKAAKKSINEILKLL